MLVNSLDELNGMTDWFADSTRSVSDNTGPFVVVKDYFYRNPEEIRALALRQEFVQYSPPLPEQVGEELAAQYSDNARVLSTSLYSFTGKRVLHPVEGFRYNSQWLRLKLSRLLNETISTGSWKWGGDWWNGAFHLRERGESLSSIHHHYKKGDVEPRGWSGVVYLSPDGETRSGTSVWRSRTTRLCVAGYGSEFHSDVANFDLAYLVENRFNRLVLFRENVLHRAERGFGLGKDSRLVQTFFFSTA
jgi:hypothetical protein